MTQIVLKCGNTSLELSAEEKALRLAGAALISVMELNAWHVNPNGNLITGDGSAQRPFVTVDEAVGRAVNGDRIFLANANYGAVAIPVD